VVLIWSAAVQNASNHPILNLRVGGRIADEISRIAKTEQNSVSAVARRLIVQALETCNVRGLREPSR